MNTEYSIAKPRLSPIIWGLIVFVVIGLFGLGIAAYVAFSYLGIKEQALAYSIIIELGGILEAFALVKGNKKVGIPALVISLAVSISYNYTQASQANALLKTPLNLVELIALAVGPLAAVTTGAMMLGNLYKEYEVSVKAWESDKQAWSDKMIADAKNEADRKELLQRQIAFKEQERKDDIEKARVLAQIEADKAIKLAEIASSEKLEAKKIKVETSTPKVEPAIEEGGTSTRTSRGTYEDYVELLAHNGHHEYSNKELAEKFNVSTRSITDWRKKYAESHPQPALELN